MFDNIRARIWLRWQSFILKQFEKYYVVGCHCGLCGKWIPDKIAPKFFSWGLCDGCAEIRETHDILWHDPGISIGLREKSQSSVTKVNETK